MRPRTRPAARPRLETLEDRAVPASLSIGDVSILEGDAGTQNAVLLVTLSGPANPSVTVNYSTANGSAFAGSDYQAVSGTLTFLKGQTSKSILVPVIGDLAGEPAENFFVDLTNAKHATIADGRGVVTITDDDVRLSIGDMTAAEGNTGTTAFNFGVTLSAPRAAPVTVNWATADGTAAAGSDYQARSGMLTFAPGETSKTIQVLGNGDRLAEPNETFVVNLSGATNAGITDGQGMGTVTDDEPYLRIGDASTPEGNAGLTPLTFTVTLSAVSDAPVTVNWATADGTATAGSDYEAAAGSLTIPAGQLTGTITVRVNGDRAGEQDETFVVNLTEPVNAGVTDGQGVGNIVDDEPRLSIGEAAVMEGYDGTTEMTFTVSLWPAADGPVTVDYATADYSAVAARDYQAASGTLSFAAGETTKTISVLINGDLEEESDEYFLVNLSNPIGAGFSARQGWGTILNDEPLPLEIWIDGGGAWEGFDYSIAFTVHLSFASSETVTVDYFTSDDTAVAGSDYWAASGTVTFLPGETVKTIRVGIIDDTYIESNEMFFLHLSGWGPAGGVIWSDDQSDTW